MRYMDRRTDNVIPIYPTKYGLLGYNNTIYSYKSWFVRSGIQQQQLS